MVDMANGADVDVGFFPLEFATSGFYGESPSTAADDGAGGGSGEERREEGR